MKWLIQMPPIYSNGIGSEVEVSKEKALILIEKFGAGDRAVEAVRHDQEVAFQGVGGAFFKFSPIWFFGKEEE
jgi:hypothetical protein